MKELVATGKKEAFIENCIYNLSKQKWHKANNIQLYAELDTEINNETSHVYLYSRKF